MFNKLFGAILDRGSGENQVDIPKVDADDDTIKNVLNYVFAAIGAISVLMIIIGGIRYIISTGDPQKTTSAKNTIIYAIVGLVISVSAFIIVSFLFKAVGESPGAEVTKYLSVWR